MAYTPRILTDTDDYEGVRFAAQRTVGQLSDDNILSPVLLPAVETTLIGLIPGYASLGVDDTYLLRSACVNLVAARAISRLMKKETAMEYSYTRDSEAIAALETQAWDDLSTILPDTAFPTSLFITYGPTKAKVAAGDFVSVGGVLE